MRSVGFLSLVLGLLGLPGCQTSYGPTAPQPTGHIVRVAALYALYGQANSGRAPANEAQFKQFLKSLPAEAQKSQGISDVDQLFVSPRDKQPYEVIYGLTQADGPPPIVVYEKQGVEGKRLVAYSGGGGALEVGDAEFRKLVPSAK